jgi:hypothetical protein
MDFINFFSEIVVFETADMPYADVSVCGCVEGNYLSPLTEFHMTHL